MSDLDRLEKLVGRQRPAHQSIDWDVIEHGLDLRLPSDYKAYLAAFPPGAFQDELITVTHPAASPSAEAFVTEMNEFCREIEETKDSLEVNGTYRMRPTQGGLLPWGFVGEDLVLCWETASPPEQWNSVIATPYFDDVWSYPKGMLATLIDLISGSTGIDSLSFIAGEPNFVKRTGY
ncbi:hypothetical protein [Actinocatenispora rupis]|uniref:Knr4/Smi1-like domain-containing protein n=1 Tax=Actinocatenispora rupis TaxID=519421 RepID=A0A8J3JAS9_9ACTN|nr:hypothetical protein [Actinocatenispora rupis]GID14941.1 hypothetical protein Aru02nite_58300 [Actinocatenispora rupis]